MRPALNKTAVRPFIAISLLGIALALPAAAQISAVHRPRTTVGGHFLAPAAQRYLNRRAAYAECFAQCYLHPQLRLSLRLRSVLQRLSRWSWLSQRRLGLRRSLLLSRGQFRLQLRLRRRRRVRICTPALLSGPTIPASTCWWSSRRPDLTVKMSLIRKLTLRHRLRSRQRLHRQT